MVVYRSARVVGLLLVVLGVSSSSVTAQGQVVTRGESLQGAPVVQLGTALQSVDEYMHRIVALEGKVAKVCQAKGCWMELVAGDDRVIRVTFKDYAFFVPTDSTAYRARLEGTFEANRYSKQDADHLIAEGVPLTRNPDGTATEISFVAQGVELRR